MGSLQRRFLLSFSRTFEKSKVAIQTRWGFQYLRKLVAESLILIFGEAPSLQVKVVAGSLIIDSGAVSFQV